MKQERRDEEESLDQAAGLMVSIEATLALALQEGRRNRDHCICVTVWTAKEPPRELEQAQLHEYMQEHHKAGFIGTQGVGAGLLEREYSV